MRRSGIVSVGVVVVLGLAAAVAAVRTSDDPVATIRALAWSTEVVDRQDRLLRATATPDGRWRFPARPDQVDPRLVDLLIAFEDKRFHDHAGVDPLALARAAVQFVTSGRVVSGGSTLTMQVARLLEPKRERSLGAKLRQIVTAIRLERHLSKDEVLALYFGLAPYGGNLEGLRAGSLAWFGKEPRRLTLGEAALLVALPQSPEARRPDRFPTAARRARDRVIDRLAAAGRIEAAEVARAKSEPVPTARRAMPLLAPHLADRLIAEAPAVRLHRTTIEAPVQAALEDLARARAPALGAEASVAILVVDHASGEVAARVGSAGYFEAGRAGQVDMTSAVRSPGSTLKPFIYGLGFEDGFVHPETLVDDRPVRWGAYAPQNFDLDFQGTVTARRALQLSLNTPAVQVLDRVGPHRLTARLAQAGVRLTLPPGESPGLAMGLGGAGVTLADLARLYGGLARLGTTVPLVERREPRTDAVPLRLMEPVAAWSVAHVLLGTPPPEHAAGGRIAFKTGTSYGYRDAWAIGFDGARTVGVWVGRPDGASVPGLTGRRAAAPILFDAFARLGKPLMALPSAPNGTVFAATAKLPLPLRRFRADALPGEAGAPPPRIVFPPDGAQVELVADAGGPGALVVKVAGGVEPVTVLVDGFAQASLRERRSVAVTPRGPGFVRLTVTDARGASDSVLVRAQ